MRSKLGLTAARGGERTVFLSAMALAAIVLAGHED
jgi:hypothetical protein